MIKWPPPPHRNPWPNLNLGPGFRLHFIPVELLHHIPPPPQMVFMIIPELWEELGSVQQEGQEDGRLHATEQAGCSA